jgi:hypothetical protein
MATTVTTGTLPLALAEALSDRPFKMYIYMEYANNSANIPTSLNTDANISNFNNPLDYYLNLDNTKNFLRVSAIRNPLVETVFGQSVSSATTTYIAQTTPDSARVISANPAFGTGSICYGAALVLAPSDTDITKDIVMARSYFTASGERLTKSSASELFITFPFTISSSKAT